MIVSWNWLKEYVPLKMSVDTLVDRVMMAGLNHESTEDVEGDIAVDLEVTSNRPDCLGHLGIAREVAALFGESLKLPATTVTESNTPIESLTSITIDPSGSEWCPQYRARVIEGVKIGPSPDWMQRRLRSVGLTPINNVVDVTNYVLMECGQPLHAFDFDKLQGKRIIVRSAAKGEKFRAINNRDYALEANMGVIADEGRPVAVAGVMGGADTEVSDQTVNILLESAEFAPLSIRRTSRALDLMSDSSYRFERKIDPAGIIWACERAASLIQQIAGGKAAKGVIHVGKPSFVPAPVTMRWQRVERILGITVPREEIVRIFATLGLSIESQDESQVTVLPPSFRRDLSREIDLIEEVGRIYGYDQVSENEPIPMSVAPRTKRETVVSALRDHLVGAGYCETVTFTFCEEKTVHRVRPWTTAEPLVLTHTSRKQENRLRQSVIPSLLGVLRFNEARSNEDINLFEVAQVFLPEKGSDLPEEPPLVGMVTNNDIRVVRGHFESLLDRLRIPYTFTPVEVPGLAKGKAGEYRVDSSNAPRLAIAGILDSAVQTDMDLRKEVTVCEFRLETLVEAATLVAKATPLADQPPVVRDLAILFDEKVKWAEIESSVRAACSETNAPLERVEFVDLYRGGKQVPSGKKSLAFRLTYRALDRTLTREEVDGYQQKIVDILSGKLGGELRA